MSGFSVRLSKALAFPGYRAFFAVAVGLWVVLAQTSPLSAQSEGVPGEGSWGLRFALPDGGGGTLGAARFLTDRTSLGVDLSFRYRSTESTGGPGGPLNESSGWSVGVTPELRHYLGRPRAVMPFVLSSLSVQRTSSTTGNGNIETRAWMTTARAGLGAEWFPTDWVGISGSTGIDALYVTTDNERITPPATGESSQWEVGVFRSEIYLSLYF